MTDRRTRHPVPTQQPEETVHTMKKNFLAVTLLLCTTAAYFAPALFSDSIIASRDSYLFYNPRRFFAAETISNGALPLWNPFIGCGVPFQANLQSSVFYPLSVMYYVLPFQTGFKYFVLSHYFLAALFMFALMRMWNQNRFPAVVAALTFSFGGYCASILDNVSFLTAFSWLPLIMLLLHLCLVRNSLFFCLLAGLSVALQVFAGDASFYLLSTLVCTWMYALFGPFSSGNIINRPRLMRRLLLVAFAWGIGLGIAAVQLIPFAEFALMSVRGSGLSFEQAALWSFHPLEGLQLLLPYLFGSTVPGTRWFGQLWLDTFYLGIFPFAFVLIGIMTGGKKMKAFLLLLTAISVVCALGRNTPVYRLLYLYVPGFSSIKFPVKFLAIAHFCLSVLAGMGCTCYMRLIKNRTASSMLLKTTFAGCCLILSVLFAALLWRNDVRSLFMPAYFDTQYSIAFKEHAFDTAYGGLSVLSGLSCAFLLVTVAASRMRVRTYVLYAVVLGIIVTDLLFIGKPADPLISASEVGKQNSTTTLLEESKGLHRIYSLTNVQTQSSFFHLYGVPFHRTYRALNETLTANLNMYYHIQSAGEYSALLNRRFYELFAPVVRCLGSQDSTPRDQDYATTMLNLLNVRHLISPAGQLPLENMPAVLRGPVTVYHNPGALDRAFFVNSVNQAESDAEVLSLMHDPAFDPKTTAYITKTEAQQITRLLPANSEVTPEHDAAASVHITEYTPGRITIETRTAFSRFLVLSDCFYPGWQALLDGKQHVLVRTNHALRGVPVPAGKHVITLLFRPFSFKLGVVVSCAFLVITGIGLMCTYPVIRPGVRRGNAS